MELRQLQYFVTVAEELHFGRAAERLHIVQPAVSQQIRRLERELDLALFDRSSRHVRLTGDGERLLPEARAVLAAADRTLALAGRLATGKSGSLRLGTSPDLGPRLERGLETLRQCTPDLDITLVHQSIPQQLQGIRAGEIDIALMRAATATAGLQAIPMWTEALDVVLPADHPLAAGPTVALKDLQDMTLRLPDRSGDPFFHDFVIKACTDAGFVPHIGRPATNQQDTVTEIGLSTDSWTVRLGNTPLTSRSVAIRPLEPALTIPGQLVMPAGKPTECTRNLLAAFA
ncbi:MAG TPA: LysR family transcriptional regulator [Mycobacteriales bacterium]|nr:LysR family transcriptional regulator [Mycobacteriales bacterium]